MKAISKKLRFEIFKRDQFLCQYCGAHPPDVILHVDHIMPVAKGGQNEECNLITSCSECNLGKGARLLSSAPKSLKQKEAEIREREAQVRGYYDVVRAQRDRIESEVWEVIACFPKNRNSTDGFRRDWFLSIQRFIQRLGVFEVLDAMQIASAKKPYASATTFRYFCGICWTKIREAENV